MKSYLEVALALLLVCAASSPAQYIGGGRPWTAARSVADSTRLDSVATASEAEDTTLHARVDSVRDNASGGGDGSTVSDTTITPGVAEDSLLATIQTYYQANMKQLFTLADQGLWADNSFSFYGGTHGHDFINFKRDTVAVITNASALNEGSHIVKALDLTHFAGGDTCVMADYVTWGFYLTQDELDTLVTNVGLSFCSDAYPTFTNYAYYSVAKGSLAAGWNYVKVAKSAFATMGTLVWESVAYTSIFQQGSPPGTVTWTTSNIAIVKKDPALSRPNPFQLDGVAHYQTTTTAGVMIMDEGTVRLGTMVDGDYIEGDTSYAQQVGGYVIAAQVDSSYLISREAGAVYLQARGGTNVYLYATTGDSAAYTYSVGDTLKYTFEFLTSGGAISATIGVNSGGDTILTGSGTVTDSLWRVPLTGLDRANDLPLPIVAPDTTIVTFLRMLVDGNYYFLPYDSTVAQ